MNIYHVYCGRKEKQDPKSAIRDAPTWDFVNRYKDRYNIINVDMNGDNDYDFAFQYMLNANEDFAVLEQDIVPTPQIIDEIEACPEKICIANYELHLADPKPVFCPRIVNRWIPEAEMAVDARWITKDEKWCDLYGLGFTRFRKEVIPVLRKVKIGNWSNLDTRISNVTYKAGIKAHVHGQVVHNSW
jgi:hypothetical protein